MSSAPGERNVLHLSDPVLLQLFGCVDWAPSDLITAFLLAGAAQSARRRVQVAAIMAAGGSGSAPSSERKPTGPPPTCTLHAEPTTLTCEPLSRLLSTHPKSHRQLGCCL